MPSILNLKFKGNKSFVPFSNLGDADSLTMTWKVCTKVASFLEQGQRLENLSWRLWHLQNLMVDTDNAKSKREFRKLSKCMSDKLDKEKGRSIEELQAPGFRRNHSTDVLQQRALEKEREREATNSGRGLQRMQFTFSIEAPFEPNGPSPPTQKPDLRPSAEFRDATGKRGRQSTRPVTVVEASVSPSPHVATDNKERSKDQDKDQPLTQRGRKALPAPEPINSNDHPNAALHFPTLFNSNFGPAALLYPTPTLTNVMTYGEGLNTNTSYNVDGFSIPRPTIELGLDELLNADSPGGWASSASSGSSGDPYGDTPDMDMKQESEHDDDSGYSTSKEQQDEDMAHPSAVTALRRNSLSSVEDIVPRTITPSRLGGPSASIAGVKRPALSVRTSTTGRASGPSATPVNGVTQIQNNSAPGGVKAECSNCGATHTPLWRRGLNDELNCNACGLYCKLHKRPRPKNMRNNHGEGRAQTAPRQESQEVVAQCYNCHTTATPLWRKDDEGKTVCNACGLYYKLHGSPRPISMKSDVIRKRARHDARRTSGNVSETPSASPGASRRASPVDGVGSMGEPNGQLGNEEQQEMSQSSSSELMGALGNQGPHGVQVSNESAFNFYSLSYPGPYHPDYVAQLNGVSSDGLSFGNESPEYDGSEGRSPKRRRMSNDSVSDPPSSATSYSSYSDSFSSSSAASQSPGLEFPFSYNSYGLFRQQTLSYFHPPMVPPDNGANAGFVHPPMIPPEESPMDFLQHPPMHHDDTDSLFSAYLHPPMALPGSEDSPKVSLGSLQPHPPMLPQDWGTYDFHDSAMQAF
jgi:GATA-binding protein, other eukaryote